MARETDKKDTHAAANTQSSTSSGGGIKEAASTTRANTTSAPSTAPVTRAGSDTRDTSGSTASMVSGSSDTGTPSRGGNGTGGIGSAVMEAIGGNGSRGNSQQTADPVDPHPNSGGWDNFTDFTDTLSPSIARNGVGYVAGPGTAGTGYDVPGEPTSLADFLGNVRNGSLGSPRAAGYGLDHNPDAAQPSLLEQIGSGIHDFVQGPYQSRVNANGGVAPFEGPVDTQGMYEFLQAPYNKRQISGAEGIAAGALQSPDKIARPTVRIRVNGSNGGDVGNTSPSWQEMRARLLAADRLPSDPNNPNAVMPAYTDDHSIARTLNPDGSYSAPLEAIQAQTTSGVPLPRRDPRGYNSDLFATDGQVTGPDGAIVRPGVPAGAVVPEKPAEPSTWDKIVDNTGKILSHTSLGTIVSGLFPDLWNGMGDAFKNMDNGGMGSLGGTSPVDIQNDINRTVLGDPKSGRPSQVLEGFVDLNHNGIDDRLEGYTGVDTQPVVPPATTPTDPAAPGTPSTSNIYDHAGDVVFPTMPPYQPGKDNEWLYFRKKMAAGGIVGYAEGGPMGDTPDPRFNLIADAEDALDSVIKTGHQTDADKATLAKFAQQFGPDALQKLAANVQGGMKIRSNQSRLVRGPGGPTDDAVPAQTDSGEQVRLSNGEFIMPVAAVAGMGDGDHKLGAERLQQLSERLAAARG